jgi:hypothetical protein
LSPSVKWKKLEEVVVAYLKKHCLEIRREENHQESELAAPLLKRLVAGFPPRRPGFNPGSGQVGFVVDKVSGQVFSEYFGFPCHSLHQILHPHNHPGQVQ